MSAQAVYAEIIRSGVVAIIRLPDTGKLTHILEALLAGGVTCIEVALNTPGAVEAVDTARKVIGDRGYFGIGTVMDRSVAERVIDAGAQFVVSPIIDEVSIDYCLEQGVAILPGAMTPTEIARGRAAGAEIIKLFPNDLLGPRFVKAIRAPMPEAKLMPTGGVTADNVSDYLAAGAVAVGVGNHLVHPDWVQAHDYDKITARSRALTTAIHSYRQV